MSQKKDSRRMKQSAKIFIWIISIISSLSLGCIIGGIWTHQTHTLTDDPRTHIDAFGKTHFILGYEHQEVIPTESVIETQTPPLPLRPACSSQDLIERLTCEDGGFKQAFFSPDDDLETMLVNLIEHEQEALKIAIFSFTNGNIAQALARALDRGVKIELVIDASCLKDRFNKIEVLKNKGVKPHIYQPASNTLLSDIMHNKFVIFKKNIANKPLLWTGSFNFTKSAQLKNQENVIIIDERHIIARYETQYEILKKRVNTPQATKVASLRRTSRKKTSNATLKQETAYA